MYTFTDKGDRSITLRPEGTAGICRAAIENGLLGDALPLKVSYVFNCFRYEKAQRGRFRQFHQFGVECYGATGPVTDAEVISLAWEGMQTLGLKDLTLAINSIGCPTCRAEYHKALRAYFESRREDLCETCKERLEKNPMRILDCKSPVCGEIAKGAPRVLDYLCDDCRNHFEKVQTLLKDADIPSPSMPASFAGWITTPVPSLRSPFRLPRAVRRRPLRRAESISWAARMWRASALPWVWNGSSW